MFVAILLQESLLAPFFQHLLTLCLCVQFDFVAVVQSLNRVQFFVTTWTVACQAPLSIGFSRQEYWNGLSRSPPGNLPDPGTELTSLGLLH